MIYSKSWPINLIIDLSLLQVWYIGINTHRLTCIMKLCNISWISISHMHTQQCIQYHYSFLHLSAGQVQSVTESKSEGDILICVSSRTGVFVAVTWILNVDNLSCFYRIIFISHSRAWVALVDTNIDAIFLEYCDLILVVRIDPGGILYIFMSKETLQYSLE